MAGNRQKKRTADTDSHPPVGKDVHEPAEQDTVGDDAGASQIAHERAARDSTEKESWVRQLRRIFRLSIGRPYRWKGKRD